MISSEIPTNFRNKIFSIVAFIYVVVAFGLSGVPGVSRIALIAAAMLMIYLFFKFSTGKLHIPSWSILLLVFYIFLATPAIALEGTHLDRLGTMLVVLVGTLSISIAIKNNILSYKIVVYGALVASIINIVAIRMGIDTSGFKSALEQGRHSGLMANPNALCVRMSLAGFMVWLYPELFSVFVRMFGIFITCYGMYITGSRKGLMLVAALFLLVFVNTYIKLNLIKKIVYGSFAFSFMLLSYGVISQVITHYSTKLVAVDRMMQGMKGREASFSGRQGLIETGYKLWLDSPVWGYGFDQFTVLSGTGVYAHNNYIELAVSGGIIALLLFYSIHFTIIKNSFRQSLDYKVRVTIFIATVLVMDTAMVSFYDKAFMCTLASLLAVSSVGKTSINSEAIRLECNV